MDHESLDDLSLSHEVTDGILVIKLNRTAYNGDVIPVDAIYISLDELVVASEIRNG